MVDIHPEPYTVGQHTLVKQYDTVRRRSVKVYWKDLAAFIISLDGYDDAEVVYMRLCESGKTTYSRWELEVCDAQGV